MKSAVWAVVSFMVAMGVVVSAGAEEILENGAFEQVENGKSRGWALSGCFKVLPGEGHNGNMGLVWAATNRQGRLHAAAQTLKGVKPGDLVKMSALVKREGFRTDADQGAVMSLEWRDKDMKWIKALYALTRSVPEGEWGLVQATGLMPANARFAVMRIYVSGDSVGKISWDNVAVSTVSGEPVQNIVTTVYRNTAVSGKVGFHASILPPPDAKNLSASFSWKDAAGNVRRVNATRLEKDEAFVELDVADLAMGCQTVTCELFADGKRLGSSGTAFTRVSALPQRRVWIDGHNRCIVDDKPFFPLGMYWNPGPRETTTREDGLSQLDWFTNGPFNCVIHYEMMDRKRLDYCQKIGLMTLNAVDAKLKNCATGRLTDPYAPEKAREILNRRIAEIKDHPALLGWYIGDEVDVGSVSVQRKLYRLVADADEHHPIYGVQDRTYDLRPFADTMDVVGLDPYPIAQRPTSVVTTMFREGRCEVFSARPMWGVPQAFDWAWYRAKHEKIERFPTCAEMRSMNWQMIANGANGLFLFAFNCYFYPLCKDDWRPRFAVACEAAREVKRMSDVILSAEPAPKGTPNTDQAVCRTWVKDGKAYVLVCSLSAKPLDVSVTLDAGAWKMDGTEVGTPATMAGPRKVAFYLDPIGVSLVRLAKEK